MHQMNEENWYHKRSSFLTLKVGHLVAFMFYLVTVSLFQCVVCAMYSLCVGGKSLSSVLGE